MDRRRFLSMAVVVSLAPLTVSACSKAGTSSSGGTDAGAANKTLVIDNAFDLKTTDPARSFEFTGVMLDRQIYETALSFTGGDLKKVVNGLCSYSMSADNKVLTLKLDGAHKFSDGSPVTADDIVFSYQRVIGIAGNPAFLLDGVAVAKTDDTTITLTSTDANPQLPFILPNPSLGIINSKVVKANGGTTDKSDGAEAYINKNSVGSGPYMIESYDVQSKVVLKANPNYDGAMKPGYGRVVVQNVDGPTQKVNIQSGKSQIATSLGPDQVKDLDTGRTKVVQGESTTTIFMWFNMTPEFGKTSADVKFVQAMRHAINYKALLDLIGTGAKQPGGMVPVSFLGSLASDPNNTYDPDKAKALLATSTYKGEPISILYSSDVAPGGVKIQLVAETIQAQVKAVGINLTMNPQPSSTSLDSFRSGKAQAGVAYWGADYPDPADYLVFAPGQSLAKRAAWTAAMAPESDALAKAAAAASGDARGPAYQAFQTQGNIDGPFIPLFQPPVNLVIDTSLKGVVFNPLWQLDFAGVS